MYGAFQHMEFYEDGGQIRQIQYKATSLPLVIPEQASIPDAQQQLGGPNPIFVRSYIRPQGSRCSSGAGRNYVSRTRNYCRGLFRSFRVSRSTWARTTALSTCRARSSAGGELEWSVLFCIHNLFLVFVGATRRSMSLCYLPVIRCSRNGCNAI